MGRSKGGCAAVNFAVGKFFIVRLDSGAFSDFLPEALGKHVPIEADVFRSDPDAAAFFDLSDAIGRSDHDLCWDAAAVETSAAERSALHNGDVQSLGQCCVCHDIGCACTDDDDIIVLHDNPSFFVWNHCEIPSALLYRWMRSIQLGEGKCETSAYTGFAFYVDRTAENLDEEFDE